MNHFNFKNKTTTTKHIFTNCDLKILYYLFQETPLFYFDRNMLKNIVNCTINTASIEDINKIEDIVITIKSLRNNLENYINIDSKKIKEIEKKIFPYTLTKTYAENVLLNLIKDLSDNEYKKILDNINHNLIPDELFRKLIIDSCSKYDSLRETYLAHIDESDNRVLKKQKINHNDDICKMFTNLHIDTYSINENGKRVRDDYE